MLHRTTEHGPARQHPDAHHFEASGFAPFAKFPRGAIAGWKSSSALLIEAKGGLLHTPKSLFTLGRGTFRIRPIDDCQVSAVFPEPVYFLSYRKLANTLRDRYVLKIALLPDLQVDLWPYLFAHYAKHGQWPSRVRDFARFFRSILSKTDIADLSRSRAETRLQRIREEVSLAAMLRIGRARSASLLARENSEKIIRKLVDADFCQEVLAEMDAFFSLKRRGGIVPLEGEFSHDEIQVKTPFAVAVAERLTVKGRCNVEFMWEYDEYFDGGMYCTFVEVTPQTAAALPGYLKVYSAKAHIPLDSGEKSAYGTTFSAPLICKGEEATLRLSDGPVGRFRHLKEDLANRFSRKSPRHKPGDLFLKISATEI
jgi:hypothetical protein